MRHGTAFVAEHLIREDIRHTSKSVRDFGFCSLFTF
jgi:hypothetical protein